MILALARRNDVKVDGGENYIGDFAAEILRERFEHRTHNGVSVKIYAEDQNCRQTRTLNSPHPRPWPDVRRR